MTREEHIARCMLLGMKYVERYGYYIRYAGHQIERLDANSLKPVPQDEAYARQEMWLQSGKYDE